MLKRIIGTKTSYQGFIERYDHLEDYRRLLGKNFKYWKAIGQWRGTEEDELAENVLEQVRKEKGVEGMVVMTAFKEPDGAYRCKISLQGDTEAGPLLQNNLENCLGTQLEPKNMHGLEAAIFFELRKI